MLNVQHLPQSGLLHDRFQSSCLSLTICLEMPGSVKKDGKLSAVDNWISDELSEAHFHLSNPRRVYSTV